MSCRPWAPRRSLAPCAALLLATAWLGSACTYPEPETDLSGLRIDRAHLEELRLALFAMGGGAVSGDALLVAEDVHGFIHEQPLDLKGQCAGWLGGMAISFPVSDQVPLELPPEGVNGEELFGVYRGGMESIVLPAGVVAHTLRNPFGVELDTVLFSLGVSISVTWEWLSLLPAEEEPVDAGEDGGGEDGA